MQYINVNLRVLVLIQQRKVTVLVPTVSHVLLRVARKTVSQLNKHRHIDHALTNAYGALSVGCQSAGPWLTADGHVRCALIFDHAAN